MIETDLDLPYISTEAASILHQAEIEETISSSQIRWLWDTIGDLIGEVERLCKKDYRKSEWVYGVPPKYDPSGRGDIMG